MERKLYDMVFDDENECLISKISLVNEPAIESNFMLFSKQKPLYFIKDKYKKLVSGAIMIPDLEIYRYDDTIGEYYVKFSKDTIYNYRNNFHKNKFTSNVNLDHVKDINGVYMVESFIKDDSKGISPSYLQNIPDGTWVGTYKIENNKVWNAILKGKFKGFSVEINANMKEIIDKYENNNNIHSKSENMKKRSLEKRIKLDFRLVKLGLKKMKFGTTDTDKGILIYDGDLELGKQVSLAAENSDPIIAPDGDYNEIGDNNNVITVVDGIIESITDVEDFEVEPSTVNEAEQAVENVESIIDTIGELVDDAKVEIEEEVKESISEIREELKKVRTRLSKIEQMPAAKPLLKEQMKSSVKGQRRESQLDKFIK